MKVFLLVSNFQSRVTRGTSDFQECCDLIRNLVICRAMFNTLRYRIVFNEHIT